MKKKVTTAILFGYLAISLGCVTFAWMNEPNPPSGDVAIFEFDADTAGKDVMRVQSRSISCTAYAFDDALNDFVNLDSYTLDTLFSQDKFVPGKYVQLKFSFTNTSTAVTDVTLSAYDIESSNTAIFSYIYFGVNKEVIAFTNTSAYSSSVGRYTTFDNPNVQTDGKYSLNLLNNINIVPTPTGKTMDIYCYVMLSNSADSTFYETSFSLGHFRVIM